MTLDIHLVPLRTDNYAYLLRDGASGHVAVVDPSDSAPVIAALDQRGWRLNSIMNTHHHPDHTGGNAELAAHYGVPVAGPSYDQHRIPALSIPLSDSDTYDVGETRFDVLFTPGHTTGHITFYSAAAKVVFTGDTLFSLGCGRLFEGTAAQMWHSFTRLRALPPETRVYCGHEYTQSNCRFAVTIEPDNAALRRRETDVATLRAEGKPTIPSTIALERAANPFMRADDRNIAAFLAMEGADPVAVFAELRQRKDRF